ncbi:FAD:protein FMN transferase [Sulfurimonas sp.]|uniref:FAD:protein FMN transferase n=1 Tax=Sulfurimonas sp. TaxID=2022749 RepID=UPI0025EC85F3|nr:FAD:protein FMN transferase [Sulfurimonas sp.]MDD5157162.1 FAD:protein FMN transferase [Sulfurimonas sp.]
MRLILILFFMALTLFSSERMQVHMGTMISVKIDDENATDAVFSLFKELDESLSTYKSNSEISRLNRYGKLQLTSQTKTLLERSLEISKLTNGVFDVTIGALSHGAYRFGGNERVPNKTELKRALVNVGADKLTIKEDYAFLSHGAIVDLGGIAKGYAVDLSIELLKKRGVDRAVVAASGDIGCIGVCEIAITDPFSPNKTFATIHSVLPIFAVSTSGNYERFIKNKTHNHLLNPKTGKSEQLFASVTLMDNGDNTRLDAMATAVSIMSLKDAIALLRREKISFVLVLNSREIIKSELPDGVVVDFF